MNLNKRTGLVWSALVMVLLLAACSQEEAEVPGITETQVSQVEQAVLNVSNHVREDGIWVYASTGDSGKEKPATIVSVELDTDTGIEDIVPDFVSITNALRSIEFEIPLGHLVIIYSDGNGKPLFVYMSRDLIACTLTDYRGAEPELKEYTSIDELELIRSR